VINLQARWTDSDSFRQAFERIKFSFCGKEQREKLQERLRKNNEDLSVHTYSSRQLAPSRRRRALQAIDFERIRKNACRVHSVLESGPWCCNCSASHVANLRLETRLTDTVHETTYADHENRFRVIFSIEPENTPTDTPSWNWHETDIVPSEHEESKPSETQTVVQLNGSGAGDSSSGGNHRPAIPKKALNSTSPHRRALLQRIGMLIPSNADGTPGPFNSARYVPFHH